jgi:hypothetical protein
MVKTKLVISLSMTGDLFGQILFQEITELCNEFEKDINSVMSSMGGKNKMEEINYVLAEIFPGQLKIIK